jgi:hypothetical protein
MEICPILTAIPLGRPRQLDGQTMRQMCDFEGQRWYLNIDSTPASRESEPRCRNTDADLQRLGPGPPAGARADGERRALREGMFDVRFGSKAEKLTRSKCCPLLPR